MTKATSQTTETHVKETVRKSSPKQTFDLHTYAEKLHLSVNTLMGIGLTTIDTQAGSAIEIPYRRRDGTDIGRRIRRCLKNTGHVEWSVDEARSGEPIYLVVPFADRVAAKAAGARWDANAKSWYIPPDADPAPFAQWPRLRCLYGLDHAPAAGQPVFLCCDEPACHIIWQHGFDAIGLCEGGDFLPERDDHELELYDITALIPPNDSGLLMMKRLSLSRIRHAIKVVELDVVAAALADMDVATLLNLAQEDWRQFNDILDENPHLGARSEILLKPGEQPRIVHAALKAIRGREMLYEQGGELVRLCGDTVVPVEEFWLSDFLGRSCVFYREKCDRNGDFLRHEADTPSWLCKMITKKHGERGLNELSGIITAPTLRPDGSLLDRPGFDHVTGLLLRPGRWPKVPKRPTRSALTKAWETVWKPFAEFPYVSVEDRAVTVAALLTAVIRRTLPRAPAFSIDAPTPASGKTLLATCIAEVAGGKVAVFPECREEEELRKRLLSGLRDNLPSFLLDNIKGQFQSSALEAFLTDDYYSDRVLGASQMLRLRTNVLVLISGNNFTPVGDLWRRILTARIDPRVEHAERRNFQLDARQYCCDHRQQLVAAILTLMRGFIESGAPRRTKDRLASFEAWDDFVRQCVLWLNAEGIAELGDPTASINKAKNLEPGRRKLRAFLGIVREIKKDERWRTNDLIQVVDGVLTDKNRELRDVLREIAGERNAINPRVLGRWIERHCDTRCDGLFIEKVGEKQRAALWRINAGAA